MLKRLIDITASGAALTVLSPVLAVTAYRVKKNLGSPVLFKQTRPGLHGKPFEMIKFRTMKDATDSDGNLLPDSERLTPEPPRDCRRFNFLREYDNENTELYP